ncbi:hypothetical protein GCM10023331_35530 [Algivirga pacifica]|uniref:SCP domain-containing protein n=1 Tax=Algivirga pacifica TaxID=1162670 RepID=A0ABP9DN11_9BACT
MIFQPLQAQENLIPNASFEEITTQSRGHSFLSNVANWYNANQRKPQGLYGTPDHMYINTAQPLKGVQANIHPRTGSSALGLITYMQRVGNYREYASVMLKRSLEKGHKYQVTMYVSNGHHTAYGSIATNGLGVALSKVNPQQYYYEPLTLEPQFYIKDILYTTEWNKVTFEFVAEDSYMYLTVGNFFTDDQIEKRHINFDIDPQAYVYLDDFSLIDITETPVEEVIEKEKEVAPPVVVKEQAVSKPKPPKPVKEPKAVVTMEEKTKKMLKDRSVQVQHNFKLSEGETSVTVFIWDLHEVDGDQISILYNGKWIKKRHKLKRKKLKLELPVEKGKPNRLIMFADDLGTIPPNTAAVIVRDQRSNTKTYKLISDLGRCGAIQFQQ